jgi:hypothetical protein
MPRSIPAITANRIQAKANAKTVVAPYAEAVNGGRLELPVKRIVELQDAPEAHPRSMRSIMWFQLST